MRVKLCHTMCEVIEMDTSVKVTYGDKVIGIITEYEDIVLNKRKTLSYWYFNDQDEHDEKLALEVFRYVFEKLLHWTPEMVYECKDPSILSVMHLTHLYKHKIHPPKSSGYTNGFMYIATKLYPNIYKEDIRGETLSVYKKVLAGEIEKIPKNFFDGQHGIFKLAICLQHIMTDYMTFTSPEGIYETFANPSISKVLDQYKLKVPSERFFETPVDFVHFAMPTQYKDDVCFSYAKMLYYKNRLKEGGNKQHIQKYIEYINCKIEENPMRDTLNNFIWDAVTSVFHCFVYGILPHEEMFGGDGNMTDIMKNIEKKGQNVKTDPDDEDLEYDFSDRNTLYYLMFDERIDFLLDKYRIRDMVRAVSTNYIDAIDKLLAGDNRDVVVYEYASKMFAKQDPKPYKPLPMIMRKYIAALRGSMDMKDVVGCKDDYKACLVYLKKYVVDYDKEFRDKPFKSLLNDKAFLAKYKLDAVSEYKI